ncbi:hypothetical protein KEM54_004517 [Ascosphaera aggregata]|nr:hypothetical protein KEM54_004517 [Ascosphaera aggregata]
MLFVRGSIRLSDHRALLGYGRLSYTTPLVRRHRSQMFGQFRAPFAAPLPDSLGGSIAAKDYKRTRHWACKVLLIGTVAGISYGVDKNLYASCVTRSLRTFWTSVVAALDYKINFRQNPPLAKSIEALHARNARRLYDLLRTNSGLYLKIGQAIAMQSSIMPPDFQKMFATMFDDAPQNDWKDVEKVIREDFDGQSPEEVFGVSLDGFQPGKGVMERAARASASVAQVHWACLADGREIAIKIQKREIARQVKWDLWAFKVVTYIYSKIFDIPFYSLIPFVAGRLYLETDFVNEANNAEKMADFLAADPKLQDRVHVPKIYRELSTKRVLTTEWIEGARLWDKDTLTRPWRGGYGLGSPGCKGTPLDAPEKRQTPEHFASSQTREIIKPDRKWWKGRNQSGGLGVSLADVMGTMVDLFSAQIFLWGFVHCDPHPGNIIVRRQPSGRAELVILDHGLYVRMSPKLKHEYARLWKALLAFDNKTIQSIVEGWGVKNADVFASATLMRPYQGGDGSMARRLRENLHFENITDSERAKLQFELHKMMRDSVRDILGDETRWPHEMIFIARNLRIVQGNNQFLGSPVNRIKKMGVHASRALIQSKDLPRLERLKNWCKHLYFRVVLVWLDAAFWITWARQLCGIGGGMEDEIESQVQRVAGNMGFELQHNLFEG